MAEGCGVQRVACFGWLLATGGTVSVALSLVNTTVPISWHVAYYIGRMLSHACFLCAGLMLARHHDRRNGDRVVAYATMLHGCIGISLFLYGAFENAMAFTNEVPRAVLVLATYGALLVAGAGLTRTRGLYPTSWPGSLLLAYAAYKLVEEACRDTGLITSLAGFAGGGDAFAITLLGVLYFVPIALNGGIIASGAAIAGRANPGPRGTARDRAR